MRKLIYAIALLVSSHALSAQTLISYSLLRSFTKAQIDSVLNANGIPASFISLQHDVDIFKVLYRTPYKHPDSLVQASGALAVPRGVACGVPLAMWGHGTETKVSTAASALTGGQWELGIGFASTGYAVALPDYLGMGDKDPKVIIHPYQHAFHEANTSVNMLRASREISSSESVALNGQVFLLGYSQGGYVTVATAKDIQLNHSSEFQISGIAPMSGSYDMDGVQYEMIKSDSAYATPAYLPYLVLGYNSVMGTLFDDPKDIFKSPYDTLLPPLFYAGNLSIGQLNNLSNPVPKRMFKDSIVDAIFADSLHPFRVALRENNLVKGWVPQFPTRLFYCNGDEQVTYLNSEVAFAEWSIGGAPDLAKFDFGGSNHTSCAQFTVLAAKFFLDSVRIACPNSIADLNNESKFTVYPNPASEVLHVVAKNEQKVKLFGIAGNLVKVQPLNGGSAIINIADLPRGIYVLKSGDETRKVIKQ